MTGSGKGVNLFLTLTLIKVDSAGRSTLLTGTGFLHINGTSGYTDFGKKIGVCACADEDIIGIGDYI